VHQRATQPAGHRAAALRDQLGALPASALITTCTRLRPSDDLSTPQSAVKTALRSLARRHRHLDEEIIDLSTQLASLVTRTNPTLIDTFGVGPDTPAQLAQLLITCGDNPDRLRPEAAFTSLCGAAPIPGLQR
jgi:hypothetical protein